MIPHWSTDPFATRTTLHGLPSDEVRSALHKHCRQGRVEQAIRAVIELVRTDEEHEHMAWTRLRIIAARKGVEKLALEHRRLTLEVGRKFTLSENAIDALTSLTRGNFRFTQGAIVAQLPSAGEGSDGKLAAVREIVTAL